MISRTSQEKQLFHQAQEIAKGILSGEVEPVKGSEQIYKIYIQLNFPDELEYWQYIADGGSREWEDSTWIPGILKYNHEKWLEAVMREASFLVERKFS